MHNWYGIETEAGETAEKAYTDFNAAIRLEPSNALYYNGRGRLCVDFKLFDEAIADLEKAIRLDGKFAVAYSNLGLAKLLSARTGLAELNRAIELNPRLAEAYFNRANYHRVRGDLDEAAADYSKAIAEHGTNAQYYNGRGMVYFAQQNGTLAAKDFSSAISQKQDFATAYLNRALTYKKYPGSAVENPDAELGEILVNQRRKMKADLDAAIKYGPNLADAYLERGLMTWTATGSTLDAKTLSAIDAALADFDRAIEIDPAAARAFASRGAIHQKLGRRANALADYNKAIELDPRLATAYMGRMAIHCEMGNKELSFADEKKASELGVATINICSLRR